MNRKIPVIDYGLCMACGICVAACPFGSLDLTAVGRDGSGNAFPAPLSSPFNPQSEIRNRPTYASRRRR